MNHSSTMSSPKVEGRKGQAFSPTTDLRRATSAWESPPAAATAWKSAVVVPTVSLALWTLADRSSATKRIPWKTK